MVEVQFVKSVIHHREYKVHKASYFIKFETLILEAIIFLFDAKLLNPLRV